MEEALKPVVSALQAGLIAIIGAAVAYAIAWFKAKTSQEEQKAKAAVQIVEALTSPQQLLTSEQKKAMAVKLVVSDPSAKQSERIGELVERVLPDALDASSRVTRPD